MSTNYREVCLEIYVDGEFYCSDTCWVLDEEDVQVELEMTDAIYDLLGCSTSDQITAQLEVDTLDGMSVSYCALEGDDVQVEVDMNDSTCEACKARDEQLETDVKDVVSELVSESLTDPAGPEVAGSSSGVDPETSENSPTESTKGWMMNKISGFFQMLFGRNPAVPEPVCVPDESVPELEPELDLVYPKNLCVPDESVPELEPELDLVYPKNLCVPDESVPELEPELDLVDPKNLCVPDESVPELEPELDLVDHKDLCVPDESVPESEPELDLVDPEDLCVPVPSVPESEPELDLVDSDDSCVPGPSSSEPKPDASTSEMELFREEDWFLLEKRVKACTQPQRPVTEVWNNIFIGNEEIARDRMRLQELGITHILNAAAVKNKLRILMGLPWEKDLREAVNTGARYYSGMNITYCGFPTTHAHLNISKYFLPAAKFIHKAKKNPENKVFIHCTDGVSYAPTLFLAYLMMHHKMTVEDAIDYLIKLRYIKPNIEFLKQLAIFNEELVHM